jgi:hypothetical protein
MLLGMWRLFVMNGRDCSSRRYFFRSDRITEGGGKDRIAGKVAAVGFIVRSV